MPSSPSVARRCAFSSVRPSSRTSSSGSTTRAVPNGGASTTTLADDLAPRRSRSCSRARRPSPQSASRARLDLGEVARARPRRPRRIDEPGRMSWNCCRSSSFQSRSSSARGYVAAARDREELGVVQRLLAAPVAALHRAPATCRRRGGTRSRARRRRPAARPAPPRAQSKNSVARHLLVARQPLQVRARRSVSSMSARRAAAAVAVAEDEQARAASARGRGTPRRLQQLGHVCRRCCTCRPAGSAPSTSLPSSPCQTNVWCSGL